MSVPVLSVDQMRQWEQSSWGAGRSQPEVIATAGRCVAQKALELTRSGSRILVLAGKGHNGDDTRAAAQHLADRRVDLVSVVDPTTQLPELQRALKSEPSLIIDGLFGIGLSRPLESSWVQFIEEVNHANLPVLAVDVPSGLNADTGEPQPTAIKAEVTLTLGAAKRGLLASRAAANVGRLELADAIGLVPCPFNEEVQWTTSSDFAAYPPRRRADGHKGTYGHVAIFAGSPGYHGAAVLAARAALRARPGLVSVFCAPEVYVPVASQCQAAMVHSFEPPVQLPSSCSAVVFGPGLAAPRNASAWQAFLHEQWRESPLPMLVDASALEWLEPSPAPLKGQRIITPHPGEAARLLGKKTDSVQADRVSVLRELSRRYGNCSVVLKGNQTLVGRAAGEIFVNPTGNPYLAQGGAGDVLSGFLGGLLARTELQEQPLQVIRYGTFKHGQAADRLTAAGRVWTIEDLLETLGD